jgi:hypothetical protein
MANSNNSTSLYNFTSSNTVSRNDFTTLYNTTPGSIVTANVPDRNFTTLYTKQTNINPTYPYGNSNVEAFLNVGSDIGGNQVQNIVMHGNITVGSQSYLGNVGNVHITGGALNYILKTDGGGNLNWEPFPNLATNTTLYIHFDVNSTGNNQSFTYGNLAVYANSNVMAVMKNGINIEPSQYSITGDVLTINIPLNTGDTIDVLPGAVGSNLQPGGNITEVQYNGGSGLLAGNNSFTFDQAYSLLTVGNIATNTLSASIIDVTDITVGNITVGNITVGNISDLGNVGNVKIAGGSSGQYLRTDGLGNLSWVTGGGGGGGTPAGSNTYVQYNNNGNFGADSTFTFNASTSTLTVPTIIGTISNATYATTAGSATTSGTAVSANIANYAINVTGNAQPNITSLGQLYNVSVGYSGFVDFTNTTNVSLGSVYNVHMTGGGPGDFLTTNGSGGLAWATPTIANANYASYSGQLYYNGNSGTSTNFMSWAPGYQGALAIYGDNGNRAVLASASNDGNLTLGANLQYSTGPTQKWVFTSSGNLVLPGNTFAVNYANGTQVSFNNVANANYANYAGSAVSANIANYAVNVTGGTQSNITSLGTLTSLTVSGNITTGNISSTGKSNIANTNFTKFQETVIGGGSVSGTITPDAAAGTIYTYTLTGNITLNSLANVTTGTSMTLRLTQDASGNRTLTSTMKFAGGSKTLSTAASATDIISVFYDGTSYYAVLSKGYV